MRQDAVKPKRLSDAELVERQGRVARALKEGLNSGALDKALAEENLEDIRARTAAVLFGGISTGQLEQAFQSIRGEPIQGDVDDALRARTAHLLVDACKTGRLDVAFAAASEESEKHNVRLHARQALEAAVGALEDVAQQLAAEQASDDEREAARRSA